MDVADTDTFFGGAFIISKDLVDWFAGKCSVTPNYTTLATIVGNAYYESPAAVQDLETVGAEFLFEGSNTVYYFDSRQNCYSNTVSYDVSDQGPQFWIFNVDPTLFTDNKATMAASHASYPVDSVTIPVRAGELTFVDMMWDAP